MRLFGTKLTTLGWLLIVISIWWKTVLCSCFSSYLTGLNPSVTGISSIIKILFVSNHSIIQKLVQQVLLLTWPDENKREHN